VFPDLGDIYAPGAKVIHLDLNAYEIGKNHRVDLGIVCDPKVTLQALADRLEKAMTPEQKQAAQKRFAEIETLKKKRINTENEQDIKQLGKMPLHMAQFAQELARALPKDAVIFDEALTNSPALTRYLPPQTPGSYFVTRGGSLGVGIPGALGVKLLNPEKTVIGFSGDGGSMYTIQALWSAARHAIGAKFVICNNGVYKLLELNIDAYWKEQRLQPHDYPADFDLSRPAINFVRLAEALGVKALRVERPEQIAPAIRQMLDHDGPFLIDLVLTGQT
jgi:benzoylformate decarboxylase